MLKKYPFVANYRDNVLFLSIINNNLWSKNED